MTEEGAASEIGGDGKVGLVEEVLITPGDWKLDFGSGEGAEAVGLGDGVNGRLWSVGKLEDSSV